ncbi:MAG TPA: ABC transporter ATP-binding protein [bacterium]|nr:ABC transporter ATP-binding protein [bacterium]HQG46255.1 ABC transporter ATP-binding protein [bacterium]HQI49057.1 ABC transporter ATP-binding protein [bacterium]HQJ65206.1 ABC transporter ATP-binding protein [bacterium]
MIELVHLHKSYNGRVKAVDDLTLTIPPGQIVGFLGPNGAGKTTTLKMLTGILNPDSGEIRVNDLDLRRETIRVKEQIGFIPDSPDMFLRLTGLEYLRFMADLYHVAAAERKQRIATYVGQFEMGEVLGNKIQSYSHGMRQKIVLIGALLHDPAVWVLDEPLTGLDPKSSFLLKEILRQEAGQGKTVFFSTHVLDVAERLCDRVAIIHKGKLLFDGTIAGMRDHFKANESLEKMFLEMTDDE